MPLLGIDNLVLAKKAFKVRYSLNHISDGFVFFAGQQFKVVSMIIRPVPVFVVNMFPSLEGTIKNLRHNQAMFVNFPSFVRHRVFGAIKFYVTMICYFSQFRIPPCFSSSKSPTLGTTKRKISLASTLSIIIFMRYKMVFAAIRTFYTRVINTIDFMKLKMSHDFNIPYLTEQCNKYCSEGG